MLVHPQLLGRSPYRRAHVTVVRQRAEGAEGSMGVVSTTRSFAVEWIGGVVVDRLVVNDDHAAALAVRPDIAPRPLLPVAVCFQHLCDAMTAIVGLDH